MKHLVVWLSLILFAVPAWAEDGGLYAKPIGRDEAVFRFINVTQDKQEHASARGKDYGVVKGYSISPYFVTKEGAVSFKLGNASLTKTLKAGQYYSLAYDGKTLSVFEDPKAENDTKAQLQFYNMSGRKGLVLKTQDGAVAITQKSVNHGEMTVREINALSVAFGVFEGEAKIGDLTAQALERRGIYAIVVIPNGSMIFEKATTDTER